MVATAVTNSTIELPMVATAVPVDRAAALQQAIANAAVVSAAITAATNAAVCVAQAKLLWNGPLKEAPEPGSRPDGRTDFGSSAACIGRAFPVGSVPSLSSESSVLADAQAIWDLLVTWSPPPSTALLSPAEGRYFTMDDHRRAAETAPPWRAVRRGVVACTPSLPPNAESVLVMVPERLKPLVSTCEDWTFRELEAGRFDALQVSVDGQTDGQRVFLMESGHPSSWRLQQSVLVGQEANHYCCYSYSSADWWPEHWVCRPMPRDTFGELMVASWLCARALFGDPEESGIARCCYTEPPTSCSPQLYWNDPTIINSPGANGAADIKDHKDQTKACSNDANSQLPNSPVLTITTGGSSPMDFYYYNDQREHLHVRLPAVRLGPYTLWIWMPSDDKAFRHGAFFPRPVEFFRGYRLIFVMRWLTKERWYAKEYPHYTRTNDQEEASRVRREERAAAKAAAEAGRSAEAVQKRKRAAIAAMGGQRTRARVVAQVDPLAPEASPMHRAARPAVGSMRERQFK